MAKQGDEYKKKFRPDADAALENEIDSALSGMTLDDLYDLSEGKAPRKPAEDAPASGAKNVRRGRILNINKDDVFVDFGGKSQGVVPFMQFETEPKVGDEMDFVVDRYDPAEGLLILSLRGAKAANVNWETLDVGQVVEGTVTGMNKGGLELEIKSMRAFMPAGQVDIYHVKDISQFLGQRMTVEVTQVERESRNLIVSRRNVLEREKEAAKAKLLEELAEGQTRRGTVRSVMDYGAFVDLGGVDGLLHVSEMAYRRVKDPRELVKEGDLVDVKITKLDKATGKMSLSLKQAMPDPWLDAAAKYGVGATLTGRVVRLESFGAFVEVEEGVEGLLPISEMSWQRIRHPSEIVKEGDTVKLVVLTVDPAARRMSLSLKKAGPDPWATAAERYLRDMVIDGKVTRVADFGAFVEVEPGLEGLVHVSELSANRVRTPLEAVKPGQDVKVAVLDVDKDNRRLSLSIKKVAELVLPETPASSKPQPKKKKIELRGGLDFDFKKNK